MGPLGWQETVFIFVLALLVFGPKKLPELGKTIGKAMTEFRRASSELRSTWDREMAAIEREGQEVASATSSVQNEIDSSTYDHNSSSYYDSNYDYGYGYDSPDANGAVASAETSTVSATATQGADQPANAAIESASTETVAAHAPEGTVAREKQPEAPKAAEA
jgi:sec-independent protein translocase protein TatA